MLVWHNSAHAWLRICGCKKKIVICLPMKHLRVLKNSFKRVRPFQIELEFEVLVFEEREKPPGAKERTNKHHF